MKKYIAVLLACLLLCLTGCSSQLTNASIVNPLPEKENLQFVVSKKVYDSASGKEIVKEVGSAQYTSVIEAYGATGESAHKITAHIESEKNITEITSYISADPVKKLSPIYVEKSFTPYVAPAPSPTPDPAVTAAPSGAPAPTAAPTPVPGSTKTGWTLVSNFDNTKKECHVKATYQSSTKEEAEEKTFPVADPYLDNETLLMTIRGLEIKGGYTGLLNVSVSQYGKTEPLKVSISDTTSQISTPYGTFNCYAVTLSANTIFAGGTNATTFYVTTDNVTLRIEQGPYIYTMTSYTAG